jgi:Na+-translocating ferredoxin:NAD+ oxidoreductase subunit B
MRSTKLADLLEDTLPQTQCTKCGYPDCRAYAEAMASGELPNRCPPGGQEGIIRLSQILEFKLNEKTKQINPECGVERPRPVALIDPKACIGCTLCIQACPVDAIVGASKQMHTVLPEWCTGCDLCVAPCPVDCITMITATNDQTGWDAWSSSQADLARARYQTHQERLEREERDNELRLAKKAKAKLAALDESQAGSQTELDEIERKRAIIAAAIARVKQSSQ